jgi:Flp pilus assembly protein TadG
MKKSFTNCGNRPNRRNRRKRSEEGQSLVEFAASLVVLVILVSGVLDLGRAYLTLVAIENGAGEGALFASYHPTWVTYDDANGCAAYPDYEYIEYRATHESPTGLVDWTKATVTVDQPATIETGNPITVTVTYSYTLLTPFISIMVGDDMMPIQASAVQPIISTDDCPAP